MCCKDNSRWESQETVRTEHGDELFEKDESGRMVRVTSEALKESYVDKRGGRGTSD